MDGVLTDFSGDFMKYAKLNDKNAWKKSARKPRTRNKPKTVTRGRRVKYKQYNPNGHLKSHSVSEPANNPTQPQKGTGSAA